MGVKNFRKTNGSKILVKQMYSRAALHTLYGTHLEAAAEGAERPDGSADDGAAVHHNAAAGDRLGAQSDEQQAVESDAGHHPAGREERERREQTQRVAEQRVDERHARQRPERLRQAARERDEQVAQVERTQQTGLARGQRAAERLSSAPRLRAVHGGRHAVAVRSPAAPVATERAGVGEQSGEHEHQNGDAAQLVAPVGRGRSCGGGDRAVGRVLRLVHH